MSDEVFPLVSPDLYARNAKEDGRQLTRIGNPTELGQRQLAALLRIEDLLTEIRDGLRVPAGESVALVTGDDLSTPLLTEIRDLLAAQGPKPAKPPKAPKDEVAAKVLPGEAVPSKEGAAKLGEEPIAKANAGKA